MKELTILTAEQFVTAVRGGQTVFSNYHLCNMRLKGFDLLDVAFVNCTFSDCTFECCCMERAKFKACSFYSVDFLMCSFRSTVWYASHINARFTYCTFNEAQLYDCKFRRGYIRYSDMSRAKLITASFDGTWAAELIVNEPVDMPSCSYTMGGARTDEVARAEAAFFKAFECC